MKLKPTMFYDPEPSREDAEGHRRWKRRQVEPKKPTFEEWSRSPDISNSYNQDYTYYSEHRLRFKGFYRIDTETIQGSGLIISFDEGPGIAIYKPGLLILNLFFEGGLSLELFCKICEENNIKLQEIC